MRRGEERQGEGRVVRTLPCNTVSPCVRTKASSSSLETCVK